MKTPMILRRGKPSAFMSPTSGVFCTVSTSSVFITQKSATIVISMRSMAVMFFSTARALKSSRSTWRHVTSLHWCASERIESHTASNSVSSVGRDVFTWIAYTPFSSPIRSRAFASEHTQKPLS